ncbi:MAG: hypothetical protein ACLU6B_00135 [Lachnospirales bacterium]
MKRFQVNKHFRLDIAFQSIIRFQLYCGRSVNPLEPQDSPEKPEHPAQVCLPYRTEPLYEDPL